MTYLNLLALLFGTSGSLSLAIFGLPNLKTLSSGSYTEIDESTPEIQRAKTLSKLGLWLLVIGFAVQAFVQLIEIVVA
jgi:ABC-type phosphate transport system permease subunit